MQDIINLPLEIVNLAYEQGDPYIINNLNAYVAHLRNKNFTDIDKIRFRFNPRRIQSIGNCQR